jgi:glucose/arabinose dehydrogenase
MKTSTVLLSFFLILLASCTNQSAQEPKLNQDMDTSLILPEGFSAIVVAEETGSGRHIIVNNNSDIYMSLRQSEKGGGIVALRDTNNDSKADIIRYFGEESGTGIDIHKGYLYHSSNSQVMRYKLNGGKLVPEATPEIIAAGFPGQNQHADKPFTFDNEGNIYVNVGAPSNACMEQSRTKGSPGMDPCPQLERQAGIWRFKDDVLNQDQQKDGYRYATGLRNSIALDWNKESGYLYVVQHGRDQLSQFFPDMYSDSDNAELPAEEFFLLEDGSDGGWPYCYYDQFQKKKILAPEYGGDRSIVGRCENKTDPIMAFPGHIAPNDLLFYTGDQFPAKYKNGAFIAFHGSWNRGPLEQEGFNVVFVPFNGKYPSGEWEVFADGFAGKEKIMSPGKADYRPMGLAQGPDGALYISDSRKGKIWKVVYKE